MFLLAVMAMMTLAVQADEEEFVVTSGDFKVVMQPGKIGRVEVDFTKAKVGNLSTMEITDQSFIDYLEANDQKVFKKWSEYQEEGEETFMDRWNDAKKKVIKLTKKDTPDYIIKINATQLDPGNSGAATWSWNKRGGGIIISGTLEVLDAAGNSVCKMNINRYRGFSTRGLDIKIPTFHRLGEATEKAPLLLLHGGPGSTHNYFEVLDCIAETGRQVISYDQIGCGNSYLDGHPELWTQKTWIDELIAIREYLHLDNVHLLGQSWGAMQAIAYVIDHQPQGIKSLILSSGHASSSLWASEQHRLIKYLSAEDHQQKIKKRSVVQKPLANGMILPICGPTIITLNSMSSVWMNTRPSVSNVPNVLALRLTSMAGGLTNISRLVV